MTHGPIGIVAAMAAELRHLFDHERTAHERRDGIWQEHHLEISGRPVIAIRSGIGMVNAAAATEHLLARHAPAIVLNAGCAGAHRPDIMPGDIVIGDRAVNTGAVQILPSGEERHLGLGYEVAGERIGPAEFPTDPKLLALAREAARDFAPPPWPDNLFWPTGIPRRPPAIHIGPVSSADVWTQEHRRLDLLHARHGSLCEDMEAAAVAQICALHGIPFLTIKDISNNEYHRPSDVAEFSDFPIEEVGKRAMGLAARLIGRLD